MYSKVTDSVYYIGTDDKTIDLFESQYVVPNGVSYNSYLIMDEKVAVMDTVDPRAEEAWFANLEEALGGRKPDYLVISHLEPDHAGNIQKAAEKYPDMKRPYKVWFYPVLIYVIIAIMAGLAINTFVEDPMTSVIGLAVPAVGLVLYELVFKKSVKAEA